jgi:hypothetical protein
MFSSKQLLVLFSVDRVCSINELDKRLKIVNIYFGNNPWGCRKQWVRGEKERERESTMERYTLSMSNDWLGAVSFCYRRVQTETERAPKLSRSKFIKQASATQRTRRQRLSTKNKGGFPYIPFKAGYRNGGVQLVPYKITCYFIGCFNL